MLPQIGRMHTLHSQQFQHVAVLREQGHRRRILPLQRGAQKFDQGKAGTLHLRGGVVAAKRRVLDKALRQRLHRAQQLGRRHHANHLQCAYRLMQLLAGDAQLTRVQRRQIGAAHQLRIAPKAAQRLRRCVQRLTQFVQHPGQRTEIFSRLFRLASRGSVQRHGWVLWRWWHMAIDRQQANQAILKRETD